MRESSHFIYEFGPFHLEPDERRLLRDGKPVSLTPKAFDTLVVLVERASHLVEKEELISALWPDSFVEEANIAQHVWTIRKTLGEADNGGPFIETVPKKGFRFVAPVSVRKVERALPVQNEGRPSSPPANARLRRNVYPEALMGTRGPAPARVLRSLTVRVMIVAIALGVAGLLIYGLIRRPALKTVEPTPRTIAVLPFKPLPGQSPNESLEVGLADSLISKLSKIKQITVRPTSAVMRYAGVERDPVMIGQDLQVDAVLKSSFQQVGNRFKINSQLVRVNDGKTLWSFECVDNCVGILTMQDSVSQSLTRELRFALTAEEQKLLAKRYTDDAEVYQLYLYGRAAWNRLTSDDAEKAIEYFEQALEREPNYAPAYSGLADCYISLGSILTSSFTLPRGIMPKAKYAAERAIAIDDSLAEAHASLGFVLLWYEWDFAGAKREFERAIELDPKYATAHQRYADYLTAVGHHEEAIREARLACELDPTSTNKASRQGYLLYLARQYNRAIEQAEMVHELDPHQRPMYASGAYGQLGRYSEAVEYYLQANAAAGEKREKLDELRNAFETGGMRSFWEKNIEQFKQRPRQEGETNRYLAITYALLGEKDKALTYLEKLYRERNGFLIYLKVDPAYDSLRSDLRFKDLLRRIGLPDEAL